jgi:hypothetical protein
VKRASDKAKRARTSSQKETWLKELRGPILRTCGPVCARVENVAASLPKCYDEPWVAEIGRLIDASINKVFNLKNDDSCDATTLGILAAQGRNCAEMDFRRGYDPKNVTPRAERGIKKLISFASPMQKALGRMSRKIRRVIDRQPWETQVAFEDGYARALAKKMYCGANPVFWEDTPTRLYLLLLTLAPFMHQVKSVNHLYGLLYPHAPAIVGHDPKRLEKVCQRIGLRFRKRSTDKPHSTSSGD